MAKNAHTFQIYCEKKCPVSTGSDVESGAWNGSDDSAAASSRGIVSYIYILCPLSSHIDSKSHKEFPDGKPNGSCFTSRNSPLLSHANQPGGIA